MVAIEIPAKEERGPLLANPYGHYPRVCGAIAALSLLASAASPLLPGPAMACVLALSLAAGLMAMVAGLLLRPFVWAGQQQVQALASGASLAHWTYPAAVWNDFAARRRAELRPDGMFALLFLPACGLVAGLALAMLEHWWWLPVCFGVGTAAAALAWSCHCQYSLGRYRDVVGTAEVFITPGLLAIPENVLVWNRLAPQLIDVTIDARDSSEARLVFHVAAQSKYQKIHSQIELPIPPRLLLEAEAVVAALAKDHREMANNSAG